MLPRSVALPAGRGSRPTSKAAPSKAESIECILNDFERLILPGITHWNHPAFFAYFAITGSGPGILGELLASALNVNAMLWQTSPAATELEECVLDWLREMLGLPADFKGVIADCASTASLLAIAAARVVNPELGQAEHSQADPEDLSGAEMTMRYFGLLKIFVERFHFSC